MLRLILTLAVAFALLVGVGAWFDPEGAREAIRRDLAGLAGQAADRAGEVVRDAVDEAVETAKQAAAEVAVPAPAPQPAAGPRTEKKKPPVLAAAPVPKPAVPAPEAAVSRPPQPRALEVEEVAIEAPGAFVEAPLEEGAGEGPPPAADRDQVPSGLAASPPDVGEQGVLIRRMLALYQRMSEGR
jgi:outer membrane biosynthesis protein TonB